MEIDVEGVQLRIDRIQPGNRCARGSRPCRYQSDQRAREQKQLSHSVSLVKRGRKLTFLGRSFQQSLPREGQSSGAPSSRWTTSLARRGTVPSCGVAGTKFLAPGRLCPDKFLSPGNCPVTAGIRVTKSPPPRRKTAHSPSTPAHVAQSMPETGIKCTTCEGKVRPISTR